MHGEKKYSKAYFYDRKHQTQKYEEIQKKTEVHIVKILMELIVSNFKNHLEL